METATKDRLSKSVDQAAKSARDWLAEVSTTAKARPMAVIAYGPPGVGKTSIGAAIPGCIFLVDDKEDGVNTLKTSRLIAQDVPVLPAVSTWEDSLECLRQLSTQKHKHKALVIDAAGGFEKLCHDYVCRTRFHSDWGEKGFAGYQRGYETSLPEWRLFLNLLDSCRGNGMSILLLAHSIVKPFKNPTADDYDRFVPDLHHKTWSVTHRWADMVLFLDYYVEVTDDGGRAKGRGGQQRTMYTEHHAAYEAKNRCGLPPEIGMGESGMQAWNNLKTAITQSREKGGA